MPVITGDKDHIISLHEIRSEATCILHDILRVFQIVKSGEWYRLNNGPSPSSLSVWIRMCGLL